jgi:hypothetical protein
VTRRFALVVALTALILASNAHANSSLIVGISDDWFKWSPEVSLPVARDLGVTAVRITLQWHPNETELSLSDRAELDQFVPAAFGLRVVAAVYGAAESAPQTEAERQTYCGFVSDLMRSYPSINDVVIWNEANLSLFWRPQFNTDGSSAAPGAYAALLASCWDELHAAHPGVNVISDMSSRGNDRPRATSNVSHSPVTFVRALGAAYRVSGRPRPLLDTVGLHPYSSSNEVPWFDHGASTQISQGDIAKLVATFGDAFNATAQPLLGSCRDSSCPRVWLLETGFQTRPDQTKQSLYSGTETDDTVLSDVTHNLDTTDQATQLRDAVTLAYCQPTVGAIFNFLLADETDLGNWQSGVLWADGTPKGSYGAFASAARAVQRGAVDCAAGAWNPATPAQPTASPAAGAPTTTSTNAANRDPNGAPNKGTPTVPGVPGPSTTRAAKAPTPAAPPRRVRAAPAVSRTVGKAARARITKSLKARFRSGLTGLQVVKSGKAAGWYLADGFARRTKEPIAAWFHEDGRRFKVVAIATTARQARGPGSAPCDIRPAFSRPLCR